jgi:hypothetical protein
MGSNGLPRKDTSQERRCGLYGNQKGKDIGL